MIGQGREWFSLKNSTDNSTLESKIRATKMKTFSNKVGLIYLIVMLGLGCCYCHEINCDYLDTSQRDNINHLKCYGSGCCGTFKDRYCCRGPIEIVVSVFAALVGVLIIVVIVGYCYYKRFRHGAMKPAVSPEIPIITRGYYDDVPLPSPLTRAPPVYSPHRLHPPLYTLGPFREPSNVDRNPPPVFIHSGHKIN